MNIVSNIISEILQLFSNTVLESESISVFRCIEGKVCTHLSALERASLLLNQRSELPYT
jgi:hypothetical protein